MLERALERAGPVFADGDERQGPALVGRGRAPDNGFGRRFQPEPVERVRSQGEEVGQLADGGKLGAADHLHRHPALELAEIQFRRLDKARQVGHDEQHVRPPAAQVDEHLAVLRPQELDRAPAKGPVLAAQGDHPLHEVQQRRRVALLGLDVDRGIAVHRIHVHRQVETGRIGAGEAGVAVHGPLHGRAHGVAVAQEDVVAHADLVAVVEDRRAGHGQEQAVEQLQPSPRVVHQRRQSPADAHVDAHARVAGILAVHVVALLVGDHLQGEFVVVAQEDAPLAAVRDGRGALEDLGDRLAVLLPQRHVDARHERKMEGHVALVAVTEVGGRVLGPLVGLGEQHPVRVVLVHLAADLADDRVRLGQVFVVRALAHAQVGHRVQAQAVHADVQPEVEDAVHRLDHLRVVQVQIRLVAEEAVPVIGPGHRVPGPVGGLGVGEDDARLRELRVRVAPHVEAVRRGPGLGPAGRLEPGVLVRGVVDHQLGDHLEAAVVGLAHELAEVAQGAVVRVHAPVVGDVVTVVLLRRGVEGQEPDGGDAQVLDVVELVDQSAKIADAVAAFVAEGLDVQFVDDGVLVPERIGAVVVGHGAVPRKKRWRPTRVPVAG